MEQGDGVMGTRLIDIVLDREEDFLYEDDRAMRLTPYVMAERLTQWEFDSIMSDCREGDYGTLTTILEQGFKGFHNMEPSELIEEYKQAEEKWYHLYETGALAYSPCEEDPIHNLEQEAV
jgi:hypothetical protein